MVCSNIIILLNCCLQVGISNNVYYFFLSSLTVAGRGGAVCAGGRVAAEVPKISIFSAPDGKPIDRVLISAVVVGSPGSMNSASSIIDANSASDPSSVLASITFRGSLMSSVPTSVELIDTISDLVSLLIVILFIDPPSIMYCVGYVWPSTLSSDVNQSAAVVALVVVALVVVALVVVALVVVALVVVALVVVALVVVALVVVA